MRPGKKLQVGAKINFSDELSCEVIEHTDFGGRVVRFKYDGIFEEILDRLGETPLPPYITAPLEDRSAIRLFITVSAAVLPLRLQACTLPKSCCRKSRKSAAKRFL